jgi:YjbE family integral membrane protein
MTSAAFPAGFAAMLPWGLGWSVAQIGLLDLLLAGDNAIVIALAARTLPERRRRAGLITGAGAAVVLRTGLTLVAAHLLAIPGLKLAGGGFILWLAYEFPRQGTRPGAQGKDAARFWPAVRLILWADLVMSLDNVLAVAGAAHGDVRLLLFGLALSIPLVVGASGLLARWMERWPLLIDAGAALLGKVGAGMVLTDPLAAAAFPAGDNLRHTVELAAALVVLAWSRLRRARTKHPEPSTQN